VRGVPVFALNQDASRYFDYHHSQDDTLAIVDPQRLKQNVAAWAATLVHPGRYRGRFPKGEEMTTRPTHSPTRLMQAAVSAGAVRWRLDARPLAVNACHCMDCKKTTGATNVGDADRQK